MSQVRPKRRVLYVAAHPDGLGLMLGLPSGLTLASAAAKLPSRARLFWDLARLGGGLSTT